MRRTIPHCRICERICLVVLAMEWSGLRLKVIIMRLCVVLNVNAIASLRWNGLQSAMNTLFSACILPRRAYCELCDKSKESRKSSRWSYRDSVSNRRDASSAVSRRKKNAPNATKMRVILSSGIIRWILSKPHLSPAGRFEKLSTNVSAYAQPEILNRYYSIKSSFRPTRIVIYILLHTNFLI